MSLHTLSRLAALAYLVVYIAIVVSWFVWERRKLRYRLDAWVASFFTVSWIVGIVAYVAGRSPDVLVQALRWLFFPAILEEAAQITATNRHEEPDGDMPPQLAQLVDGLVATAVVAPAVAIHGALLWAGAPLAPVLAGIGVATLAGALLGTKLPRLEKTPVELAAEELEDWLSFPTELGRRPEAIELFDHRTRRWHSFDDEVDCFLFRFRHDGEWSVGIVGPVTFAMIDLSPEGRSPEEIYSVYERWHRDELAPLLKDA